MPKPVAKTPIKVKVSIVPGKGTPAQKQASTRFWQKLIAEVKAGER